MTSDASQQKPLPEAWGGRFSLQSKLARLATVADTYDKDRRVVSEGNSIDILSAILREIDDTVLARELIFRATSDKKLTVVAVNRRLMSVSKVKPAELLPEDGKLLKKPLSENDMASINAVENLVMEFACDVETLTVTAVKTDYSDDFSNTGISTGTLAASWMLD